MEKIKKLNFGSGKDYREGWINVDIRKNVKSDVKHNLDKLPYPFKNNEFEEVLMSHVLEHLNDPIRTLKEIIRISKNNSKIIIKVPHAYSYANNSDVQHKTNFTENSFTKEHLEEYELEELKLEKVEFLFPVNKWKKLIPFKKYLKIFFNGIYDDLYFEFKVVKEK